METHKSGVNLNSGILFQNKKEAMIQRQHEDVLEVLAKQVPLFAVSTFSW